MNTKRTRAARPGAVVRLAACLASVVLAPAVSRAEPPEFGGFYKNLVSLTQVEDSFGNLGLTDDRTAADAFQRLRLKLDHEPWEHLSLRAHYEARHAWGDSERIRTRALTLPRGTAVADALFPAGRTRFLDLESELSNGSNYRVTHGLDRLSARWSTDTIQITLGRQPVSWGSGLIWTPTDVFAGFSPTEIDRDEKLGVDVVRLTWTPTLDSSFDIVAEPLDEEEPYEVDGDASSLALRTGTHLGEYDLALLGGWIAGDTVVGGDASGYLADAGLRTEVLVTDADDEGGRTFVRALVSVDYGFARAWNPYLAVEYFYNGLGTDEPDDYLSRLAEPAVQRAFQRGNAFNLGRNYVGAVTRLTPSALWSVQATTLLNIDDGSVQEFASLGRSLTDNIDLLFGAIVGFGPTGTEFGGFSADQAGVEIENNDLIFSFLKVYF